MPRFIPILSPSIPWSPSGGWYVLEVISTAIFTIEWPRQPPAMAGGALDGKSCGDFLKSINRVPPVIHFSWYFHGIFQKKNPFGDTLHLWKASNWKLPFMGDPSGESRNGTIYLKIPKSTGDHIKKMEGHIEIKQWFFVFVVPKFEETPSIELWLQIISLPPQLCGIPKKRRVFFSKHCKNQPSTTSLSEIKMGALDFATLFMSQPGGQLGQVHESRWCKNHGKTRQKNSLLQGVILYHTVPLMYQGLS